MKKTKEEKAITLIALIITIVVLLILAVVSIGAVQDSNIIEYAQKAENDYTIAQEKEQIGLALSVYQIQKTIEGDAETLFFDSVKEELINTANVTPNEDKTLLTVRFNKTGNEYIIDQDGNINPLEKELIKIGQVKNQDGEPLQAGDLISYNNETWVVVYNDNNYGLQIMSQNSKPCIELIGVDEYNGYNRAIPLLNQECERYMAEGVEYARVLGTSPTIYKDGDLTELDEFGMLRAPSDNSNSIDIQSFAILVVNGKIIFDNSVICGIRESGYDGIYGIGYLTTSFEGKIIILSALNNEENGIILNYPAKDRDDGELILSTTNFDIFPIMIMNKNIQITGGNGVDIPYTYTFAQ